MTRIILPAQIFFYWGALFMAVQFAHRQFFIPALAPEVIAVVFQRWPFTAESAAQTAPVLRWHLAGAFAAMTIVTRCFYSLQNTWLAMLASTLAVLGSLPLYAWCSRQWRAPGIALAGSLAAVIQLAVLLWLWRRQHGQEAPWGAAGSWAGAGAGGGRGGLSHHK